MPADERRSEAGIASVTMQRSLLLGAALVCIVVSVLLPHVGMAGVDPRRVARVAVYVACVGNFCLMGLIWVGSGWWRLAGIGLMGPIIWVVLGAHSSRLTLLTE